jgi:Domain of Unknown Function (DUF1080)
MRRLLGLAALLTMLGTAAPGGLVAEDDKEFVSLFDGKTLAGWKGDPALWSVEDGMIVGTTDAGEITQNTFLVSEKSYGNFELKVKFRLRNGNSGIQFRSKAGENFRVTGYQADIADNDYLGILYSEGTGRGILANVKPEELKKHVHPNMWNEYVLVADGPHLTQDLNGFRTVDFRETVEDSPTKGILALQLHAGPKMRVEFKDILIREIP